MPTIRSLTLTTIALLGVTSASIAASTTPPTTLRPGQRLTPSTPAPHRSAPATSQTERSSFQGHRTNADHALAQRLARIDALRADAARSGNHAVLAELDAIHQQLMTEHTAPTPRASGFTAPGAPGATGTAPAPSNSFSFATENGRRLTPEKVHHLFATERDGTPLVMSDDEAPVTRRVVETTIAAPMTGGGANGPSTHATTDDPQAPPPSDRRMPPGVRSAPGSGAFANTAATAAAPPAAPTAGATPARRGATVASVATTRSAPTTPSTARGSSSRGTVDQRLEQLARTLQSSPR